MNILDAARYIIHLSHEDETLQSLTPLKLQKILYFAQGWSFVWDNTPLFAEPFEAWQYGPVNRLVYDKFKQYKGSELPAEEGGVPTNASEDELETIRVVWNNYGSKNGFELVELTHSEGPWKEAYETNSLISSNAIREHFMRTY